jgi:hypothetical protein
MSLGARQSQFINAILIIKRTPFPHSNRKERQLYTTESILKVVRMSRPAIVRDLINAGVCGPFSGWTRDELEARWLEARGEHRGVYSTPPMPVASR